MGKYLNKFKKKVETIPEKLGSYVEKKQETYSDYNKNRLNPNNKVKMGEYSTSEEELDENINSDDNSDDFSDTPNSDKGWYDEIGIQPAQKPESFHHFILENQYKDLERSIRGLKDVWNKDEQKWITKRKALHCFTDEEAEDILRTAQSHLATDVKLGHIRKESFGDYMDAMYKELAFLFESIAEYRYGRYGAFDIQYNMKLQNQKIFLELFTRVQANYSRSIGGSENIATHGSVKGQESLQSGERDYTGQHMGYS